MKQIILAALFAALTSPAFASETVEGAKKDFQSAKAEISAQLESLDKKIDELKASTKKNSTAAKEKALKEAEETRASLRADYEEMKEDTNKSWMSFKKRVSDSLDKMNAKAQKALKD